MLTTPAVLPVTTPERFDGNHVDFTGLVTKIWARSSGDVFARIAIGEAPDEEEDNPEPRAIDARLTLRLPDGQVNGQDISLLKGDAALPATKRYTQRKRCVIFCSTPDWSG
jgi:hypothetical protein